MKPHPLADHKPLIQILDTRSRKSWAYIELTCPSLGIHIRDWVHLYTPDNEFIGVGYGFSTESRGTACDEQSIQLLSMVSNVAIEHYFYMENGKIVDRFGELDTHGRF